MNELLKMTRRNMLKFAGLGTVAALAACAPKPTPEPAPAEPAQAEPEAKPTTKPTTAPPPTPAPAAKIPIQYWLFWNQPSDCEADWRATDEWKAMEESGLEITLKTGAGGDAGKTAVAAGTPPDVGNLGPQLDFAIGGVLMDLNPFIDASDKIARDMFFEESYDNAQWQDMQFGVPALECYVRLGLDYNIAMVEEAGLDPDSPPETWDEVFEWHNTITQFDEAGNIAQFGLDPDDAMGGTTPHYASGWTMSCSFDFVDWWDPATATINVNRPEFVEGLKTYAQFIQHIGIDNLAGVRSVEGQGTWGGSYNAGVQAMIIEGYWHPGETANQKPEIAEVNRATWLPVPSSRKGDKVQLFTSHATALYRDGENASEAFPIIEFQQSKSHCDIAFDRIGWLPAIKDYIANVEPKYPGLDFYLKSASEATHRYTDPRMPIGTFVGQKIGEYREQVYREEITAEQAAEELQRDVETEWEESGWQERWATL